jgi:hypothetical protein
MDTESVVFDKTKHEIGTSRVTLVFNRTFGQSAYPERTMITPEGSLSHFRSLDAIDPLVARLFGMVFSDFDRPVTKENLDGCEVGCQHIAGLLDLSLRLILKGEKFGWKFPEACLHPRHQANLADVVVLLSDKSRLLQLAKEIKS